MVKLPSGGAPRPSKTETDLPDFLAVARFPGEAESTAWIVAAAIPLADQEPDDRGRCALDAATLADVLARITGRDKRNTRRWIATAVADRRSPILVDTAGGLILRRGDAVDWRGDPVPSVEARKRRVRADCVEVSRVERPHFPLIRRIGGRSLLAFRVWTYHDKRTHAPTKGKRRDPAGIRRKTVDLGAAAIPPGGVLRDVDPSPLHKIEARLTDAGFLVPAADPVVCRDGRRRRPFRAVVPGADATDTHGRTLRTHTRTLRTHTPPQKRTLRTPVPEYPEVPEGTRHAVPAARRPGVGFADMTEGDPIGGDAKCTWSPVLTLVEGDPASSRDCVPASEGKARDQSVGSGEPWTPNDEARRRDRLDALSSVLRDAGVVFDPSAVVPPKSITVDLTARWSRDRFLAAIEAVRVAVEHDTDRRGRFRSAVFDLLDPGLSKSSTLVVLTVFGVDTECAAQTAWKATRSRIARALDLTDRDRLTTTALVGLARKVEAEAGVADVRAYLAEVLSGQGKGFDDFLSSKGHPERRQRPATDFVGEDEIGTDTDAQRLRADLTANTITAKVDRSLIDRPRPAIDPDQRVALTDCFRMIVGGALTEAARSEAAFLAFEAGLSLSTVAIMLRLSDARTEVAVREGERIAAARTA